MSTAPAFQPWRSLLPGKPHDNCRACVIIPARNERASLPATLNALAHQVNCSGQLLAPECFEIVLFLNNCSDDSLDVAKRWKRKHPAIALHIVKRSLPVKRAHVGGARRWLMDTAWQRLGNFGSGTAAILSTDADTVVAPDWIAQNMRAIAAGAETVGGVIQWKPGELEKLPPGVQRAVLADRKYQRLQAELEHLLDPQEGDPWPRHLEHFGASLACTPDAYARAGGMPAVEHLEDVAFVAALERCGVTIRHEPQVIVYTSGRLTGRSPVGLSGQLRLWKLMSRNGHQHRVPSAEWLAFRFAMLNKLRKYHARHQDMCLCHFPKAWHEPLQKARSKHQCEPLFLQAIECERLMFECFPGRHDQPIAGARTRLRAILRQLYVVDNNAKFGWAPDTVRSSVGSKSRC